VKISAHGLAILNSQIKDLLIVWQSKTMGMQFIQIIQDQLYGKPEHNQVSKNKQSKDIMY